MKTIYTLIFILISTFTQLYAQGGNQANVWYFGSNAGIDFNTNPPSPLLDGEMSTWEGCATLSDEDGQLLIYTDGIRIWNRNHEVIPGADNLGGHNSATQSGVIVPKPESPNLVYVFSADKRFFDGGIRYAEIDMNMNGGLGAVVSTNNVLFSPTSEKLIAVQHCNEIDYWIIAHGVENSDFLVWELTSTGVSAAPIVTTIGSVHHDRSISYLKSSADGSTLAACVEQTGPNFVEVFDFNNQTGEISNPKRFGENLVVNPYGAEFSPNGELLYVTELIWSTGSSLYQFDITLPTAQAIQDAGIVVGVASTSYFGAVQNAPDGKMYVAQDNAGALSIVHNPNERGAACNFVEDDFPLGGRFSGLGLPNYVGRFFKEDLVIDLTSNLSACQESTTLTATFPEIDQATSFQWLLDSTILENETSLMIEVNEAGTYIFELTVEHACRTDIHTEMIEIDFPTALTIENIELSSDCQSNTGSITIIATGGTPPYQYSFDNGMTFQTENNLENLSIGEYMLVVQDANACEVSETVELTGSTPSMNNVDGDQANIWFFGGNAGIDFNNNPPTPLLDGEIDNWEGCATLADQNGQLLIYTNGITVWNKNHDIMPGADDLGGHNSATQSGVIVPKPESPNLVYVFSVDKELSNGGLRYAEIDMNMNGGLGGVVSTNNVLFTPVSEKLTAVRHCNEIDFWIIAHGVENNNFLVWELTSAGLSTAPVVTAIGSMHSHNSIGYLKSSADGSSLASCVEEISLPDFVEVVDFNNQTGEVSNARRFGENLIINPYGTEFSPNGKLLYVTETLNFPNSSLYQFDLTLPTAQEIHDAAIIVGVASSNYFGAIQNAPDGKMYIAQDNVGALSIVHNPDERGIACNFVENDFPLGGRNSRLGLPNYVTSFFRQGIAIDLTADTGTCNEPATLSATLPEICQPISFQWLLDGTVLENETSLILEASETGTYAFQLTVEYSCNPEIYTEMVEFAFPTALMIENIELNTIDCQSTTGTISIEATGGTAPYQYSFDNSITFQTENTLTDLAAGEYNIIVQDANSCDVSQLVELEVSSSPEIMELQISPTTCGDDNGSITIEATGGNTPYQYSFDNGITFQAENTLESLAASEYTIVIQDADGCEITETLEIEASTAVNIADIQTTDAFCEMENGSISINEAEGVEPFEYAIDGGVLQSSNIFNNLSSGFHTISMQDAQGCMVTTQVLVAGSSMPSIDILQITSVTCDAVNGALEVSSTDNTTLFEYTLDGINFQATGLFENLEAGIYTVTMQNTMGCMNTIEIEIEAIIPPMITDLNTNPANCNTDNGSLEISVEGGTAVVYSLDGLSFQNSPLFENLATGTYTIYIQDANNCTDVQTADIEENEPPSISNVEIIPPTCGADNASLTVLTNGNSMNLEYSLDGSIFQPTPTFSNLSTGTYTVYLSDENDCTVTETIEIAGSDVPILIQDVETSAAFCGANNGSLNLNVSGGSGTLEIALNDSLFQTNSTFSDLVAGTYDIVVMDELGCAATTTAIVGTEDCPIYIPNAFSPNDDGKNDVFRIYPHDDFEGRFLSFNILDRWGNQVFQIENFEAKNGAWNGTFRGKKMNVAIFAYVVEVEFSNGQTEIYTGDVTLVE